MGRGHPRFRPMVVVVAIVGLIFTSEGTTGGGGGGRVMGSRGRRSLLYGPPTMWRRTRAMPTDQETTLMNFLIGGGGTSMKHPSQSRLWNNDDRNSFLFLGQDDQPPSGSPFIESDLQDERRNSEVFGNTPHRQISAFFDRSPQSFWNLGRPRRRHRALTGNPEFRSSYLALDENPFSSYGDAGERHLMSFGARKILVEPEEEEGEEAWRRPPTQKFWRRLRSLNDRPQSDYLLSPKRQPPPGFHAIRGKRELELEGEGEGQEEEEEEEEPRQAAAINQWLRQVAGRVRHQML